MKRPNTNLVLYMLANIGMMLLIIAVSLGAAAVILYLMGVPA